MAIFRGSFEHAMDQKGRVSVPSRFRDQVLASGNPTLIVTRFVVSANRCLDVYPIAAWERFEEDFQRKPRFDRRVILFENLYLGNAQPCEIDAQGRILIPPVLREWGRLEKQVVFSGARDKFRIWDQAAWSQNQGEAENALHDPEFLEKLGL